MLRFRVNGRPAPQGSKRHLGNGRMIEMSKAVAPWREAIRAEAQRVRSDTLDEARAPWRVEDEWAKAGLGYPVAVSLTFAMARPAAHYGRRGGQPYVKDSAPRVPSGRPDIDKLARAVLDGLVMGGVMADDGQVAVLKAYKTYAGPGETPGVLIEVEAL